MGTVRRSVPELSLDRSEDLHVPILLIVYEACLIRFREVVDAPGLHAARRRYVNHSKLDHLGTRSREL